ncbi:hypothetical protein As57867_004129, partial [Aphanomyces stellatus]
MGNSESSSSSQRGRASGASSSRPPLLSKPSFRRIADNYTHLGDLKQDLRRRGLESCNLLLGVDFTKSNEWTGKHSFQGRCLHDVSSPQLNPYEDVIDIVGRTLRDFDDDNIIPCYGFGDATTGDHSVFTFVPPSERQLPGYSLEGIRARYRDIAPNVVMAGPTSFAPIIRQAVEVVKENHNAYHILVVIADGQVTRSVDVEPGQFSPQERATMDALVFASQYPLSI